MFHSVQSGSVRSRLKRVGWRAFWAGVIAFPLLALGCSMLEKAMMFPGSASQGDPSARIVPTADRELVTLQTSLDDRVVVLFSKALHAEGSASPNPEAAPTIIFFYGNGNNLSDMVELFEMWRRLGANVLGVEYPGYGLSSGKPGEKPIYAAALAAYDYLAARPDVDKAKIIAAGQSLGTGPAIELATQRPIAGMLLLSPYTSMLDMGHHLVPWLPTSLMITHQFRNQEKIKSLTMPIVIFHGTRDRFIPYEMSKRLEKAAEKAPVTAVYVEADHNDLLDIAGLEIGGELSTLIGR